MLRLGIGRLYERVRIVRLFRDGQLIHALPAGDILPGPPPLTRVERGADQLIVVTPAPAPGKRCWSARAATWLLGICCPGDQPARRRFPP